MGEEQRREPRDPLRVLDRHALRLWAVRSRAALAERREEITALLRDGDLLPAHSLEKVELHLPF